MAHRKRSVAVVSGSRSEYGLLTSVMKAIQENPSLRLLPVCAGMHLSKEFGETKKLFKRDKFKVAGYVPMTPRSDSSVSMARSVGRGILEFVKVFERIRPDIVLVLGDRTEALSAALAAAYMNIYVAHIHGGDSARGGLDESARHSVSKFSHIHFPATQKSALRIKKLGEDPWRVFPVGSPSADFILSTPTSSKKQLAREFGKALPSQYALLVYHPLSTAPQLAEKELGEILQALQELKTPTLALFPNSDAGFRSVIRTLKKTAAGHSLQIYKNLKRPLYLSLLKEARFLIGNTSSGIIEAPYYKTPYVHVGSRQKGRERSTNVVDCPAEKSAIKRAIKRVLKKDFSRRLQKTCRSPYGPGRSGIKIAQYLSRISLNSEWLCKKMTY